MDRLERDHRRCSERFRRVALAVGARLASHRIAARGPAGESLAIDIARLGPELPARALVVLSGVHGVEAFAPSETQAAWLASAASATLPPDVGVVMVHGVNPWGMAHGRRQNESNIDLNRNWARSRRGPVANEAYDELHHLACPDTPELPPFDDMLAALSAIVAARGVRWVTDAITAGQDRHPDGLHFAGHRTEEPCAILERELPLLLDGAERVLVVDLHTGHGPYGAMTYLSDVAPGTPADALLGSAFGTLERSVADEGSDAPRSAKPGAIAAGLADVLPRAEVAAVTAEVGTADDLEQLAATYHEQWVHRHGRTADLEHEAARRRYRLAFTPDDPEWEAQARDGLARTLRAAVAAVTGWR